VITLILTVLAASIIGSVHCAGMCGSLVAFYSADAAAGGARSLRVPAHVGYNAGRLAAYAALGAGAGWLGTGLELAGALAGLQRIAGLLAGALVALWGGVGLLRVMDVRLPVWPRPWQWPGVLAGRLQRVASLPPTGRALTVGLLTGALPCGWLWAFVLTAAGTASVGHGALVMAAFWLGTLPMMLALGFGIQGLWGPVRRHAPAACAVAMIVLGLVGVAGRLRALDAPLAPPAGISGGGEAMRAPARPDHGHGRH
jgi:sulfite exporter TauE/SafE